MELHRFFRYAIEKMCKEKKSLNHFIIYKQNFHPHLSFFYPQKDKSLPHKQTFGLNLFSVELSYI